MSNNDTDFIKFLTLLLAVGLMSGLTGCSESVGQYFHQGQGEEVMGGKTVQASSQFSKKVLYLAMGVEWTKTKWGSSVTIESRCTASAITKRILLTAAHCVDGYNANEVSAVLSLNPFKEGALDESAWIKAEKIIIHEKYNKLANTKEEKNDFALVKLATDLDESHISKLVSVEQTQAMMEIISIGFGRTDAVLTEPTDSKVSLLNYVVKKVKDFNPNVQDIPIEQFDKSGICSGDSGSPGFIYDANRKEFFILGVASYVYHPDNFVGSQMVAESCHGYGVYMNILTQRSWIDKTILLL